MLNKEEEKLQREIKKMNQQNLAKHAQVLKQNKINANIQNTEQLVRRMTKMEDKKSGGTSRVPLHKKAASQAKDADPSTLDEDQIMQSIDNLDMLLANIQSSGQNGQGKQQALDKLVKKYNIKPPVH